MGTEYGEHTLKSGRVVRLRAQTWEEYWNIAERQAEISADLEKARTDGKGDAEINLMQIRLSRALTEQIYDSCVDDWESLKSSISFAESQELDKLIADISREEVEEGN